MLANRARRAQLIAEIEALRGSKVITYVTSDRDNAEGQIDESVVRPMYDHLLALSRDDVDENGEMPQVDLFLFSRGGAVDAPWRIVSMIRNLAVGFAVLVPFRAQSAATMITLGADEIILGRKGELGPIDPSLSLHRQDGSGNLISDRISVEDVMSYLGFVRDKAGITDQSGLAAALAGLESYPGPLVLGTIYRTYSHIRSVAEKLLESHEEAFDEQRQQTIINTLAEKTYAHGHAIGRNEAIAMGLPIVAPEARLEELMWQLYAEYEKDLQLNEPIDPVAVIEQADSDEVQQTISTAVVESSWGLSTCDGTLRIKAQRDVPKELAIDLSLQVQMPDGFDAGKLTPDQGQLLQQFVDALQKNMLGSLQEPVKREVARQSPVIDYSVTLAGIRWVQQTPNEAPAKPKAAKRQTKKKPPKPT